MPHIRLQRHFENWQKDLEGINPPTLEESLILYKKHKIEFPRLISPDIRYPLKVYRARIISKDSKENISNPKTFSYPPKEKALNYQRANVPGFPVFYAAMDGKTALEELRNFSNDPISKGDQIYLSEWTTKPGASYTLNYLTLSQIIGDQYLASPITKNVDSEFNRIFESETKAFKAKQRFLYDKVGEIFLQSKGYYQSSVIAYQIMYNTPVIRGLKIDGILYPSCSNNYRSVNYALNPGFVDGWMHLENVRKISFEEFTDNGANTTIKYFGHVKENKITWKAYSSQFVTNNYNYEILMTKNWTKEQVDGSKFFLRGKEILFDNFCKKQIEKVDLSDHQITQELEHFYHENGTLYFRFGCLFNEDECYFEYRSERSFLARIIIILKVLASTTIISAKKVLKS